MKMGNSLSIGDRVVISSRNNLYGISLTSARWSDCGSILLDAGYIGEVVEIDLDKVMYYEGKVYPLVRVEYMPGIFLSLYELGFDRYFDRGMLGLITDVVVGR